MSGSKLRRVHSFRRELNDEGGCIGVSTFGPVKPELIFFTGLISKISSTQ